MLAWGRQRIIEIVCLETLPRRTLASQLDPRSMRDLVRGTEDGLRRKAAISTTVVDESNLPMQEYIAPEAPSLLVILSPLTLLQTSEVAVEAIPPIR